MLHVKPNTRAGEMMSAPRFSIVHQIKKANEKNVIEIQFIENTLKESSYRLSDVLERLDHKNRLTNLHNLIEK